MFDNKKEADAHDKMLELAEGFTLLLQQHIPDIDENRAEEFGIVLAKNKELLTQACKGNVDALEALYPGVDKANNITPIAAEA